VTVTIWLLTITIWLLTNNMVTDLKNQDTSKIMKMTGYNHNEVVSKVPRLNTRSFIKSLTVA